MKILVRLADNFTIKRLQETWKKFCKVYSGLGMVWAECKQLWEEGLDDYIRQWWNWLDFIMLSLYLCAISARYAIWYQWVGIFILLFEVLFIFLHTSKCFTPRVQSIELTLLIAFRCEIIQKENHSLRLHTFFSRDLPILPVSTAKFSRDCFCSKGSSEQVESSFDKTSEKLLKFAKKIKVRICLAIHISLYR